MVKFGIIGLGAMGSEHVNNFKKGRIVGGELVAVCDTDETLKEKYSDYKFYTDYKELIDSGEVDCVLIATPHYSHTYIGAYALEKNIHTIVEKPISVHKKDCEILISAHKDPKTVFSAMFCVREQPFNQKIKELIPTLGNIRRINYIITDWFRSQAYYNSGTWRATWEGEGGGILANQLPHNMDLLQWWFGQPKAIYANCNFGKYHNIEVEDDVEAIFYYENGATCMLTANTCEYPGTNRLEVVGDMGKLVMENGEITVWYNKESTINFSDTTPNTWDTPSIKEKVTFELTPIEDILMLHAKIVNNTIEAIEKGTPVTAPAEEGMKSVEMANAMILSSIKGEKINLPIDGDEYAKVLEGLKEK